MYLLGAGPYVAGLVYVRASVARGNVRTITQAAFLGVLIILLSNLVTIRFFGLAGIGITVSLSSVAVALFLVLQYISQTPTSIRAKARNENRQGG
jgi:peptidoglycan biosynthesis protein MviN/MurJ (putative lipid II flippase)